MKISGIFLVLIVAVFTGLPQARAGDWQAKRRVRSRITPLKFNRLKGLSQEELRPDVLKSGGMLRKRSNAAGVDLSPRGRGQRGAVSYAARGNRQAFIRDVKRRTNLAVASRPVTAQRIDNYRQKMSHLQFKRRLNPSFNDIRRKTMRSYSYPVNSRMRMKLSQSPAVKGVRAGTAFSGRSLVNPGVSG